MNSKKILKRDVNFDMLQYKLMNIKLINSAYYKSDTKLEPIGLAKSRPIASSLDKPNKITKLASNNPDILEIKTSCISWNNKIFKLNINNIISTLAKYKLGFIDCGPIYFWQVYRAVEDELENTLTNEEYKKLKSGVFTGNPSTVVDFSKIYSYCFDENTIKRDAIQKIKFKMPHLCFIDA